MECAMKINMVEQNAARVEAEIAKAMGRARCFVHDFRDAMRACGKAEARMNAIGLIQAERRGCVFVHRLSGPEARSYRYSAAASTLTFVHGPKSWFLVDVERTKVYPKQPEYLSLKVETEKAQNGFNRLMRNLNIAAEAA